MVKSQKILITGVAGFIGSNLAERLLREGYSVIGIDNLTYGVKEQIPKDVEFHQIDIRDNAMAPLFKGIDTVFHLAAKNCIADCQKDPVETADINVKGTVNVLEAARAGGIRKIIYAESSALYEGAEKFPTPEAELRPLSVYARSKLAGRLFAEVYREHFGVCTTALRYFCVYGPRQDYRRSIPPLMSAFIINILQGKKPTIYGTGGKRRDFIFIDDVNDFHVRCIGDGRTDGQVYNLGSGVNYSVFDIFQKISRMTDTSMKVIYKQNLPGEAQETLADISAAKALGWAPKISIEEGIRRSIDFIKQDILEKDMR